MNSFFVWSVTHAELLENSDRKIWKCILFSQNSKSDLFCFLFSHNIPFFPKDFSCEGHILFGFGEAPKHDSLKWNTQLHLVSKNIFCVLCPAECAVSHVVGNLITQLLKLLIWNIKLGSFFFLGHCKISILADFCSLSWVSWLTDRKKRDQITKTKILDFVKTFAKLEEIYGISHIIYFWIRHIRGKGLLQEKEFEEIWMSGGGGGSGGWGQGGRRGEGGHRRNTAENKAIWGILGGR